MLESCFCAAASAGVPLRACASLVCCAHLQCQHVAQRHLGSLSRCGAADAAKHDDDILCRLRDHNGRVAKARHADAGIRQRRVAVAPAHGGGGGGGGVVVVVRRRRGGSPHAARAAVVGVLGAIAAAAAAKIPLHSWCGCHGQGSGLEGRSPNSATPQGLPLQLVAISRPAPLPLLLLPSALRLLTEPDRDGSGSWCPLLQPAALTCQWPAPSLDRAHRAQKSHVSCSAGGAALGGHSATCQQQQGSVRVAAGPART